MIRTATAADRGAIVKVVVGAGMFDADDAGLVEQLLDSHFGSDGRDSRCLVFDSDDRVIGVAVARSLAAGERLWDLTMLGVLPESSRSGIGSALVGAVESDLRSSGARMLVVETSSTTPYAQARAFYAGRGYELEGVVRDYWADGDDMVVFRKRLGRVATSPSRSDRAPEDQQIPM